MTKIAVVAMGGGPTRVINRTLYGIVDQAEKNGIKVLGARHGIEGILKDDLIELRAGRPPVSTQKDWPGAMIGSTRKKPKKEDGDFAKAFAVLRKREAQFFFYIGGNDTAQAAADINAEAPADYELRTIHVPKTIDNDLLVNDHSPGYGSAARYVAHATMGDDLDTQSLIGLKVNVIMGRNASWLTAATALARGQDGDAPHLIYFCERPVTVAEIAEDAIRLYSDNKKRGVISVSEGILGPDNAEFINSRAIWRELSQSPFEPVLLYLQACEAMMAATGTEKDDFGHPQLSGTGMLADAIAGIIKAALVHTAKVKDKVRLRADTLGYAQRAHAGEVSPVDAQEAEMVGRDAVTFAVQKNQDGTVVLLTARKPRYRAYTELRAISEVAGAVREFPPDFISAKGRDVTPEFVEYALPLAGPLLRSRQAK